MEVHLKIRTFMFLGAMLGFVSQAKSVTPLPLFSRLGAHSVFRKYISKLTGKAVKEHWDKGTSGTIERPTSMSVDWYFSNGRWERLPSPTDKIFFLASRSDEQRLKQLEAVVGKGDERSKRIFEILRWLTDPIFARIFFPSELKNILEKRYIDPQSTDPSDFGVKKSMGVLECDIVRMKLHEDVSDCDFYRISYREVVSDCCFEMIYCFADDGNCCGWLPSDGTCKKVLPEFFPKDDFSDAYFYAESNGVDAKSKNYYHYQMYYGEKVLDFMNKEFEKAK